MSSLRSERAQRRAAKRRNQRIIFGAAILLVLGAVGFLAYTAWLGPNRNAPAATETAAAGEPSAPAAAAVEMTTTASGLQYQDLAVGEGAEAQPGSPVTVHYTGWLEDGTEFDSSLDSGQPFQFVLGQGGVIPGWDEGVAGMKEGGKRRLVIPSDLAYGPQGYGPIPPDATLTFEVELLEVGQ